MRKILLAMVLCAFAVGLYAQGNTWYISILPGYELKSGEIAAGFVTSIDSGYYFTENVALHFSYIYNEGRFHYTIWGPYGTMPASWEVSGKSSYGILEAGPEFGWRAGPHGRFYTQVNLGHTVGVTNFEGPGPSGGLLHLDQSWTYGAAFGYRHFFAHEVGLNLQATYHGIGDWSDNLWDVRVGVTFRF